VEDEEEWEEGGRCHEEEEGKTWKKAYLAQNSTCR
jgi:hypothetical protein